MLRVILVLITVGVGIYAFIDCLRTSQDEVRGLPRPLWLLVIVVIPLLGGVAWLLAGRPRPSDGGGGSPARPVLAPDDDPEFLRQLEQERRRRDRERRQAKEQGGPASDGAPPDGGRPSKDADGEDHSGRAAS